MLDRTNLARLSVIILLAAAASWLWAVARKRPKPRAAPWLFAAGLALLLYATRAGADRAQLEEDTLTALKSGGLGALWASVAAGFMGGRAQLEAAHQDRLDEAAALTPEVLPPDAAPVEVQTGGGSTYTINPLGALPSVAYLPGTVATDPGATSGGVPGQLPAGLTTGRGGYALPFEGGGAAAQAAWADAVASGGYTATYTQHDEERLRARRLAEDLRRIEETEAQLAALVEAAQQAAQEPPPPSPQKVPVLEQPRGVKSAQPQQKSYAGMSEEQRALAMTLADPRFRDAPPPVRSAVASQ